MACTVLARVGSTMAMACSAALGWFTSMAQRARRQTTTSLKAFLANMSRAAWAQPWSISRWACHQRAMSAAARAEGTVPRCQSRSVPLHKRLRSSRMR